MRLRSSLIIVSVTALVLALGFLAVAILGRMAQSLRAAVTSEAARQEFVARWRPPRTLSVDGILPERLADMVSTNRVAFSRWEEAGSDLAGVRGAYVGPRGETVEVVACPTSPETEAKDKNTVVAALTAALERRPGTKFLSQVNDRWRFSSSDPTEDVELWALPGWLILFRSDQEIPLPFIRSYLEAIAEP